MTLTEFEKTESQIRSTVRSRLVSLGAKGDELEDLVQTTLVRVLNRIGTIRDMDRFAVRVARNAYADLRRLGYRTREIGENELIELKLEEIAGGKPDAGFEAIFEGPDPEILERYQSLPCEYRQAIRLVLEHGTLISAAKASGIPQGTIHSRIWRAKRMLAKQAQKPVHVTTKLAA